MCCKTNVVNLGMTSKDLEFGLNATRVGVKEKKWIMKLEAAEPEALYPDIPLFLRCKRRFGFDSPESELSLHDTEFFGVACLRLLPYL